LKLVGFAGKGRVGKTTAALDFCTWLIDNTLYTPVLLPFAQPLKEAVSAAQGYNTPEEYKNARPDDYRMDCQFEGDRQRQLNASHWVNLWKDDVEAYMHVEYADDNRKYCIVIDDVRYLNEVQSLQDLGGTVVFVSHSSRVIEDHKGAWRNHPSEELANFVEKSLSNQKQMTLECPFNHLVVNDHENADVYREKLRLRYKEFLGE